MSVLMEIVAEGGAEVFSAMPATRLRKQFAKLSFTETAQSSESDAVVLRGDYAFSNDVLKALVAHDGPFLLADAVGKPVAAHVVAGDPQGFRALVTKGEAGADIVAQPVEELVDPHDKALRKKSQPVVMPATSATEARAVEQKLFNASYKGATDLVTKYAWPWPALRATRFCAARGFTPNQVTLLSFIFMWIAMGLFFIGSFWVGLAAAYFMVFLDTVDGKLARCTMTYSKMGDVFDHGIDLIHPPFWWLAWGYGCAAVGSPLPYFDVIMWIIFGFYILQRLQEGLFIKFFGMDMHTWQKFDSKFREITARRNPNLVILTIAMLFSAPAAGMIAVTGWILLSFAIHTVRIFQAYSVRSATGPLVSWFDLKQ